MRYRLLGRSGLRVSELCLGTMTFGEDWKFGADAAESRAMFDAYVEAGGNFIDTANTYTFGTSEKLVGEFVAAERDRYVVSSKYSLSTNPDDPNAGGNARKNMRQAVDKSLRRLGTDYIDVYWLHAWDDLTPLDEIMRGLDDLVRAGKVLYVGFSDAPAWVVGRADLYAELRGWARVVGLQVEYNLIERTAERELLPMAASLGLGVLAWAPLAGGLLTGKYVLDGDEVRIDDTRRGDWLNADRIHMRSMQIATTLAEVARSLDRPPAQVALAWLRARPGRVIPIVAGRTRAQLLQNLGAADLTLPAEAAAALDEASAINLGFPHEFLASAPLRRALHGKNEALLDRDRRGG